MCSIHPVQWDNDCCIFCYNPQVPRHHPFSMKYLLHHPLLYLVAWLLCCVSTDGATQRDWQPGVIDEMQDTISGLLDCSLARFWWAIISHFNEHHITSHYCISQQFLLIATTFRLGPSHPTESHHNPLRATYHLPPRATTSLYEPPHPIRSHHIPLRATISH